jgi:DNA polymerase-3 subunit epsilon
MSERVPSGVRQRRVISERTRFVLVLAAAWAFVLAAMAGTFLLLGADLDDSGRAALVVLLKEQAASLVVAAIIVLIVLAVVHRWLWQQYVTAARQLADETETMLNANPSHRAPARGGRELRHLAHTINRFAEKREALMGDVEARVAEANARIGQEKNRLAALMSELAQSVIVCNVEGRILLYNARAMQLLRARAEDGAAKGHALVGLGRSVFAILDRNHVIHALDGIHERLKKGERSPVAHFVAAAPSGQLVRVQVAPVLGLAADGQGEGELTGFVLMVEDITRRIESGSRRDVLLQTLTQGTRASLGSIRAAVETIASFPDMERDAQQRFITIIDEEARRLSAQLDDTVTGFADSLSTEWPLEEIRGADLVAAAQRRVEGRVGLPCKLESVDDAVWLKVDSYSLTQAIAYLATRLKDEFGIRELRFALEAAGRYAHLDLVWTGAPIGSETTMSWQTDSMELGGEASPLTLKEIVERHDGEIWYQINKAAHREYFRLALPLARPEEGAWSAALPSQSRPEFYDFDLFQQPGQTPEQDGRPLASIQYTVFDTETTGLRPSEGDEIVSIGAVRIVNGRLLEHEVFEQLVDPGRPMSPEASRITGIESSMLEGQPRIGRALPAFARFCEDTVLVAHNAAFDMRFLRLKEESTGVRFTQPVLDTLLLSAVVHPNLEAHSLEAIAERIGVRPLGRHTALGDAIMTAEIFLRMLPLLAEKGIRTLGEAREASRTTYFARIDY